MSAVTMRAHVTSRRHVRRTLHDAGRHIAQAHGGGGAERGRREARFAATADALARTLEIGWTEATFEACDPPGDAGTVHAIRRAWVRHAVEALEHSLRDSGAPSAPSGSPPAHRSLTQPTLGAAIEHASSAIVGEAERWCAEVARATGRTTGDTRARLERTLKGRKRPRRARRCWRVATVAGLAALDDPAWTHMEGASEWLIEWAGNNAQICATLAPTAWAGEAARRAVDVNHANPNGHRTTLALASASLERWPLPARTPPLSAAWAAACEGLVLANDTAWAAAVEAGADTGASATIDGPALAARAAGFETLTDAALSAAAHAWIATHRPLAGTPQRALEILERTWARRSALAVKGAKTRWRLDDRPQIGQARERMPAIPGLYGRITNATRLLACCGSGEVGELMALTTGLTVGLCPVEPARIVGRTMRRSRNEHLASEAANATELALGPLTPWW